MIEPLSHSSPDWRVYVRAEGDHFVGLCAELKAVLTGATVDDIVAKINDLKLESRPHRSGSQGEARISVYMSQDTRVAAPRAEDAPP